MATKKTPPATKKPAGRKPAPKVKAKAKPAPAPAQPKVKRIPQNKQPLTPSEERFVEEYLIDLNGTQAYMRAYPDAKDNSARVQASRLLANPNIADAIAKAKAARSRRTAITAEEALQHVWGIATADVRELVEHRVGCCRYCYGKDFRFQRTAAEFERDESELAKANERAVESNKTVLAFDPKGGIGFDKRLPPHRSCPECFGEGVGRTVFKDTSRLSPGAAALYAGVKESKEGLEVKVHSKVEALEKVFKHLGLYEKDNKQRSILEGVSRETLKAVAERLSAQGS